MRALTERPGVVVVCEIGAIWEDESKEKGREYSALSYLVT